MKLGVLWSTRWPPTCRSAHTAAEEAIILRAQQALTPSDVRKIKSSSVMPRKLLLTADHCSQYNLKTHYLVVVGGALLPAYIYCLKYEALPFVLDARHAGSCLATPRPCSCSFLHLQPMCLASTHWCCLAMAIKSGQQEMIGH